MGGLELAGGSPHPRIEYGAGSDPRPKGEGIGRGTDGVSVTCYPALTALA